MSKLYTEEEVRELLRRKAKELGSGTALAIAAGVSASFVAQVLRGQVRPGHKLAAELGMEQVAFYRLTE